MMFGSHRSILDVLPSYQVDYREADNDDPDVRWTYRHTVDGRWSPNLFEFYQRTVGRLARDISIPFRLESLQRIDDTHVGEALREALVNCLVHADHEASGGVTVVRSHRLFRFENPGDLRVSVEQALQGGVSDCRNPGVQRMFRLAGFGEQAGSGIPRILRAWEEQSWRWPDLWDDKERYRTSLFLPTSSMLPEDSIDRLRTRFGEDRFGALSKDEVMALVTADVESQVTKGRFAHLTARHPSDASAILKSMADRRLLESSGAARRVYTLPRTTTDSTQLSLLGSTDSSEGPSLSSELAAGTKGASLESANPEWQRLLEIAQPVSEAGWQRRQIVRQIVIELCQVRPLRLSEIARLLNREPQSVTQSYLNQLLDEGRLEYLYPGEPTDPSQAYRVVSGDAND